MVNPLPILTVLAVTADYRSSRPWRPCISPVAESEMTHCPSHSYLSFLSFFVFHSTHFLSWSTLLESDLAIGGVSVCLPVRLSHAGI